MYFSFSLIQIFYDHVTKAVVTWEWRNNVRTNRIALPLVTGIGGTSTHRRLMMKKWMLMCCCCWCCWFCWCWCWCVVHYVTVYVDVLLVLSIYWFIVYVDCTDNVLYMLLLLVCWMLMLLMMLMMICCWWKLLSEPKSSFNSHCGNPRYGDLK